MAELESNYSYVALAPCTLHNLYDLLTPPSLIHSCYARDSCELGSAAEHRGAEGAEQKSVNEPTNSLCRYWKASHEARLWPTIANSTEASFSARNPAAHSTCRLNLGLLPLCSLELLPIACVPLLCESAACVRTTALRPRATVIFVHRQVRLACTASAL